MVCFQVHSFALLVLVSICRATCTKYCDASGVVATSDGETQHESPTTERIKHDRSVNPLNQTVVNSFVKSRWVPLGTYLGWCGELVRERETGVYM